MTCFAVECGAVAGGGIDIHVWLRVRVGWNGNNCVVIGVNLLFIGPASHTIAISAVAAAIIVTVFWIHRRIIILG